MKVDAEDLKDGYELPSISKAVTLDKMKVFLALSGKNIHTDEEAARRFGLPKAVAQGLMSYTYLTEVLVRFFGEDWLRRGKMEVAFLKPIFDEDTISTKVVVRSKEVEASALRITLDVSCENQHGKMTTVGTASVLAH